MREAVKEVERDLAAGRWVPIYFGNRFKVARLVGRRRNQEEGQAVFATLEESRVEADRRNK